MNADKVIRGNAIFNSIDEKPFKGAVVIDKNRIVDVLKDSDGSEYIGADTQVIEAGDRTVMAGLNDNHVHFLLTGLFSTYPNLEDATSAEETARIVKDAADKMEDKSGWMLGSGWHQAFWDNPVYPTKELLDKYFPNRPVCLIHSEYHGAWVNSKALEMCGINKDTPNPSKSIVVDENGEPTGFLMDSAVGLVTKVAFDFDEEKEKEILRKALALFAKFGITSITDVQPLWHGDIGHIDVYSQLEKASELTARIHVAPSITNDLDEVLEWNKKYGSEKITVNTVKQFLDGIPTSHTALLLEEYTDAPGDFGTAPYDYEGYCAKVEEAHKRGLSVKFHSTGDRSARLALDAYENAVKKYGDNGCRHCVEHCELVSPEDLKRFGKTAGYASVQPEAIGLTTTFEANPYHIVFGRERAATTWSFKAMLDSAGVIAIGSDAPTVDIDPALEVYRAVTRLHDDGKPEGGWNPTQKLTVYETLRGFTYGSAFMCRLEDELGTLEKGKFADVIILDRNLFDCPDEDLHHFKTVMTIMDGNIIYNKM